MSLARQPIDSKTKILLVEDHDDLAESMILLLDPLYDLTRVASAEEGVDALEIKHYDLFLLDVRLSGDMTGTEFTSILRKRSEYKSTPVLFITANADSEKLRTEAYRNGGNAIIKKPFLHEELLLAIKSSLEYGDGVREMSWPSSRSDLAMVSMIADGLAHGISTPLMSVRLAASRIASTIDKLSSEGVDTGELSMIADILEKSGKSIDTIMTGVRNIDKSIRKFGSSDASDAGLIFEMVTNMVAMKMEPLDIKFEYSADKATSGTKVRLPGAFARVALSLFDDAMKSLESVDGGKKIKADLSLIEGRLEVSITATADDEAASPDAVWTQHLKDAHAMAKPSEFIVNMSLVNRKKNLKLIAQVA